MNSPRVIVCTLFLLGIFSTPAVVAAVDPEAAVVELRQSCTENGVVRDNCFTDLPTLNSWIWQTRTPSEANPLLVKIGPGTFAGQFSCNDSGHVTLRGSGMHNTVIENGMFPVSTINCVNLTFSHLKIRNTGNLFGTRNLGGSTTWDNVEIDGLGYAWFDSPSPCGESFEPGVHYWFSSRIVSRTAANSATAYFNACDESWFFGSEITAIGSEGQVSPIRAVGGEVHVYGSVIRALSEDGATVSSMLAAEAVDNSEIHIHGTGIDVISPAGNNIVALQASNGGMIHANVSAYNLSTGAGGVISRLVNNGGHIHAPYLWEEHPNPPNITSVTGADLAVVTGTSGGHPHLVIYDDSCASKWFDIVTGACR